MIRSCKTVLFQLNITEHRIRIYKNKKNSSSVFYVIVYIVNIFCNTIIVNEVNISNSQINLVS